MVPNLCTYTYTQKADYRSISDLSIFCHHETNVLFKINTLIYFYRKTFYILNTLDFKFVDTSISVKEILTLVAYFDSVY